MLDLRDLTASYGPVRALDDVSLTAAAGQITAVLGANGAGKTTLLRTISGLLRRRRGEVEFDGRRRRPRCRPRGCRRSACPTCRRAAA